MSTESVRDKIVNAGLDLFSEKGYHAASMDEIAAAAGMKGPNLYKYFHGKEEIFNAIHDRLNDSFQNSVTNWYERATMISTAEELKEFSMAQIRYTLSNDYVIKLRKVCTIEQYRDENMCRLITNNQFIRLDEQFTCVFRNLIERGLIPEEDPATLSLQYFAPTTLMIQLCDRYPDRKEEYLKRIEKNIDLFIEQNFKPVDN